jgi:hypothetical protein
MNDEEERKVIYSALDDCRRLIAAGKVQRWDVVKWGVTVNVALATAAALIKSNVAFSSILFAIAVLVAIVSWQLVSHYNIRVTRARNDAKYLVERLRDKGIDYDSIIGKNTASEYSKGFDYDKEELQRFKLILFSSPILPFLVTLFRAVDEWGLSWRMMEEVAHFIGYTVVFVVSAFAASSVFQYFLAFISWCRTGHTAATRSNAHEKGVVLLRWLVSLEP